MMILFLHAKILFLFGIFKEYYCKKKRLLICIYLTEKKQSDSNKTARDNMNMNDRNLLTKIYQQIKVSKNILCFIPSPR